jgi:hypothetical protein
MYRFKQKVIDKRGKVFLPGTTVPGDVPLFALAEMVRVGDIEKVDILVINHQPVCTPFTEREHVEDEREKARRPRKHKGDE